MDPGWIETLETRTRQFAVDVTHFCRVASRQRYLWGSCDQLTNAAGSVAANHRAMRRARSTRDFAAKLKIVHEEADEAAHWLVVIRDTNRDAVLAAALPPLLREAESLRDIFGKARGTTRRRHGL